MTFRVDNEPNLGSQFLPFLWGILALRKKIYIWLWWEKPKQYTHWIQVEANVWHTTPKMKNKKYLHYYKISYATFQTLVLELIPFLQS